MTRTIRSLNKGRARIWWVTNRESVKHHVLFALLIGLFLITSHFDYQDSLEMERMAREQAEARAERAEGFEKDLPRVTFVLDARTREELRLRLAEIAGALDGERAGMREGK